MLGFRVKVESGYRSIVHLDADAFFVSCETASSPSLQGKPVAVGGQRRGIIASASYEARRLGVYTPMPTSMALKICPSLVVLPGDYEKYEEFSRRMFSIVNDYTPEVEIGSIDEGYADFSSVRGMSPLQAAMDLRQSIRENLGISVSLGLATNKLVASIASKLNKPDCFTSVPAGTEAQFLSSLPVRWLPGIGPKTEILLGEAGLETVTDIAVSPIKKLEALLGSSAYQIKAFSMGIDDRPIVTAYSPSQSYSRQETFERDVNDAETVKAVLRGLADELMFRIRTESRLVRCVEVRIRHGNMEQYRRSESLPEPTDLETDVYCALDRLLEKAWVSRTGLRQVALKFSQVYECSSPMQGLLNLSGRPRTTRRALAAAMDKIKNRYGPNAMMRGHSIKHLAHPESAD